MLKIIELNWSYNDVQYQKVFFNEKEVVSLSDCTECPEDARLSRDFSIDFVGMFEQAKDEGIESVDSYCLWDVNDFDAEYLFDGDYEEILELIKKHEPATE